MSTPLSLDDIDRRIVVATQAGLPLCEEPYDAVAAEVGIPADDVICRLKRLLSSGVIRRIGAVPNHYALGYRANGMSVWDIADAQVTRIGRAVGALDFVSHCYRRPRRRPDWPYNLFAMVHGRTRADVDAKVDEIARLVAPVSRGHTVLYSTRILKKTGLRLTG